MNTEIERLKTAFQKQQEISARPQARADAIKAARTAFEEKYLPASMARGIKSSNHAPAAMEGGVWQRIRSMLFPQIQFKHALAGGVSLVALLVTATALDVYVREGGRLASQLPPLHSSPPRDLSRHAAGDSGALHVEEDAAPLVADRAREYEPTPMRASPPLQGRLGSVAKALPAAPAGEARQESMAVNQVPTAMVRPDGTIAPNEGNTQVYQDQGRDRFSEIEPNDVKLAAETPVSTFSIDVDTASYAFVRGSLLRGAVPPKNAVRVEEMINYFPYNYPSPQDADRPFQADIAIVPSPWNPDNRLLRIGLKGYEKPVDQRPRANLVFLIDTSGSMNEPDKLPLLVNAFKMMLGSLNPDDTVSIVAYAGQAGTVLEPTTVGDRGKIVAALDRLMAGGSTAGAQGIMRAYQLAEGSFVDGGINRVILATEGYFNVGISDSETLKSFIERKRETGITLSVLGFGQGNYNDELMQALAQNGNGNASYIDNLNEARKVLVDQAGSTLFTIAQDVKIQLEFNPATVSEYRLIGYETRQLRREDFNNDRVDAGDIGSGHSVTAIYEFTPTGAQANLVDPLRYQKNGEAARSGNSDEYAFLKMRYKLPGQSESRLLEFPVERSMEVDDLDEASDDTRFAVAVAGFGQLLRGGRHTGSFDYDDVAALARTARGDDPFNYRGEFISLVQTAKTAAAMEPQGK